MLEILKVIESEPSPSPEPRDGRKRKRTPKDSDTGAEVQKEMLRVMLDMRVSLSPPLSNSYSIDCVLSERSMDFAKWSLGRETEGSEAGSLTSSIVIPTRMCSWMYPLVQPDFSVS